MRRITAAALIGAALGGAAPATAQQPAVAGRDGFQLRSDDGAFLLRLRGGIQTDARWYPDDPAPALDQFQARRVRMDLGGSVHRDVEFRLQVDFAGSRVDLLDASLDLPLPAGVKLRAGRTKGPVGLERLQTPYAMTFAERAFPTLLVPNRETGLMLHGTWQGGVLHAAAGIFNGVSNGASEDVETNDGKDVVARLFVRPFAENARAADLGLGVAFTTGEQEGTAAAPLMPPYGSTNGRVTFFRFRAEAANTTVASGSRTRIAPQGHVYAGPIGILGEYVAVRQDVALGALSGTLDTQAWQAALSWVLTGERAAYRGVRPASNFDRKAGTWGAFEVAARYEALGVDADAFPRFADPARSMQSAASATAALNWYLNPAVRTSFNVSRTTFDAAVGGTARPAENVIVTRFQVVF